MTDSSSNDWSCTRVPLLKVNIILCYDVSKVNYLDMWCCHGKHTAIVNLYMYAFALGDTTY